MLRIDCWESEKHLKTTPESDCTWAKNTGNKTYRNLHKIQAGANIESCPAYIFVKNRGVFIAPILSYTFIISA